MSKNARYASGRQLVFLSLCYGAVFFVFAAPIALIATQAEQATHGPIAEHGGFFGALCAVAIVLSIRYVAVPFVRRVFG